MTDRELIRAYLASSSRAEREYVDLIARLDAISRGAGGSAWADLDDTERAATEGVAANAREKVRRLLQARQMVRRMQQQPLPEIVAALTAAGLHNHGIGLESAWMLDEDESD
jgi:hypothetical protein